MTTLLQMLRFLRACRGWVLLSVLLGAATVACGIGLLGTSAYLIAMAALQPSIAVLQVAIVGVRFFGISRGVFRYLERLVSHSVNFRLLAQYRVWFYRSIEPLAPAGLQSYQSGDILARAVADINTLEHFYVRVVAPPVVALIATVGVCWLVGLAHWGFSLILTAGLLVNGVLIPLAAHFASRTVGAASVAARARLSAVLIQGLQGTADLVAFRQEKSLLAQLEHHSRAAAGAQTSLAWRGALTNAINLLVSNLTLWGVLLLGIFLSEQAGLDGVTLAVLALVTMASFEAVQPLGQAALHLGASLESGKRLIDLASQKPAATDPSQPCAPPEDSSISLRGVGFRYAPNLPWVLNGIDLEVAAGERVALMGPSGSGKTTLLNLLCRFWEAEQGEVRLGGRKVSELASRDIRANISLLSQGPYLFSATLRQNLLLAKPDASEADLLSALEQVHLLDWVKALPEGLDTWVGEHAQKLSGGERQRLGIARLLLQDAKIMLLDEPTSHLDTITARQVGQTLLNATRGKTVLWITHQRAGLEAFDRVLFLENGKIREAGGR